MIFLLPCCDNIGNIKFQSASPQDTLFIDTVSQDAAMKTIYWDTINQSLLDSIIINDTLPTLDYWSYHVFTDYETNENIYKYIYIKDHKDNSHDMYIVTNKTEPFIIEKRTIR
jgi:hypothetical protein